MSAELWKKYERKLTFFPPCQLFECLSVSRPTHYLRAWNSLFIMALIWLSACIMIMVSFRGGIKTKPGPDWKGVSPLVLRGLIPTFQQGSPSISHGSSATPPDLPCLNISFAPGLPQSVEHLLREWEIAGSIPEETGPCNTQGNNWGRKALHFSKIQLVVYYQCCVLIGWATTRLYVIAY